MPELPLITIGVLNWNGLERLKKTVPAMVRQQYPNKELLYVDNGSTDGSLEYLRSFPEVRIIENGENVGYGAGKNVIVREARGEYVLMLDNDNALDDEDHLERMLAAYHSVPDAAFMTALRVDEGDDMIDCVGLYYNRPMRRLPVADAFGLGIVEVPGCGQVFFRRSIFLALGGYDEIYPFNIDDIDMSARARLAGYRTYVLTDMVVTHHDAGNRTSIDSFCWKEQYYFCGWSRMLWKCYRLRHALLWWPVLAAWSFVKDILASIRFRSLRPLGAYFRSWRFFIRDGATTYRLRRAIQEQRTCRDDTFLTVPYPPPVIVGNPDRV